MVTAIPDEWQWPGTETVQPAKKTVDDYRLRMIVQDMVAEHGANRVAIMLADIAEELIG